MRILPVIALAAALCAKADPPSVLTRIDEAMRLTDDECRRPLRFLFTGQVLSCGSKSWILCDETGGASFFGKTSKLPDVPLGSSVRLGGDMTVSKDGERQFLVDDLKILGPGRLPPPVEVSGADIRSGRCDFRLVRLVGVISSVIRDEVDPTCSWAVLRTTTGPVYLTLFGVWNEKERMASFIDAEVEVSGRASPIAGLRHNLGRRVSVGANGTILLRKAPPEDPFSAQGLRDITALHRQRASGCVLAHGRGRLFLRTFANRILPVIPAEGEPLPEPGTRITVAGFAEADPYRLCLTEARIRVDAPPSASSEPATRRSIESLFTDELKRDKFDMSANGLLVTLRGISDHADGDTLLLSSGDFDIFIDLSAIQGQLKEFPADGSVVEVSGLCLAEFDSQPQAGIYPAFRRFTVYPRTAADLTVVSRPPWWTPSRLLILVGGLLGIISVILVWNIMLKRKSERRGKELYEEKIGHALTEQKVEERTRLAVELHDSVSQTLTGVALQLDGGEVETAKTMLASCRGELRRCLWDLRSRTFEEKDMTEAITRTITPHLNGCAATVRFNVPRERLSESLTHAILRIVRELVVNAIRHGQPGHVKIAGEMHGSTVSFSVADDGRGFDPGNAPGPEQGHFGLLGIRERIEDFNGEMQIASAPNQGARFTVTLTATDETDER